MARRATKLHPRKHKNMLFYPYARGNKRELKSMLVDPKTNFRLPNGQVIRGRIADKRYFRIFKHKNQGWTLYISNREKMSHGGLRVRSSGGKRKTKTTTTRNKSRKQTKKSREKARLHEEDKVRQILSKYEEIQSGPHSGKFKNKETGDILTETQLRLMVARRGK